MKKIKPCSNKMYKKIAVLIKSFIYSAPALAIVWVLSLACELLFKKIGLTFGYDQVGTLFIGMGETVVGAVAAAFVFIQLESGDQIEEARFMLEHNKVYIENKNLHDIELYLECRLNNRPPKDENHLIKHRQDLVNYLVYLEGMASDIHSGILQLEEVDRVFSYRFFLAMNSTEVQELELNNDGQYYIGCIQLYEHWLEYREAAMKQYTRSKLDIIPHSESNLMYSCNYELYLRKPIRTYKCNDVFYADIGKKKLASMRVDGNKIIFTGINGRHKKNIRRALLKTYINEKGSDCLNNVDMSKDVAYEVNRIVAYKNAWENRKKKYRRVRVRIKQ